MRGASTITQQLAKNLYLSPSRNPLRKLRELIIARRLEADLEKARIFELYLNLIEWGDGIYGIEAAAHEYFGTTAAALGPSESALLAGAIINPRVLTPARPTSRLLRRQRIILSRMGRVAAPSEAVRDEPAPVEAPEEELDEDLRDDPVAAEPPPSPEPKTEPAEEAPPSEPAPQEPRSEPIDAKPLPFPIPSH
jgi:monofunctional biosynthetic peptidoglycan transglycosylase